MLKLLIGIFIFMCGPLALMWERGFVPPFYAPYYEKRWVDAASFPQQAAFSIMGYFPPTQWHIFLREFAIHDYKTLLQTENFKFPLPHQNV